MSILLPNQGLVTAGGFKPIAKKFEFSEQREHAQEILDLAGPLDDIDLLYGQVMVAKYLRQAIGVSGLLVASEQTRLEDRWQGKIGLVLKVGPMAFQSDSNRDFGDAAEKVKRGVWVGYQQQDGFDQDLVGIDGLSMIHCRVLQDAHVRQAVRYPDRIW